MGGTDIFSRPCCHPETQSHIGVPNRRCCVASGSYEYISTRIKAQARAFVNPANGNRGNLTKSVHFAREGV